MQDSLVKLGSTIHQVLEAINHTPVGTAFVVNDENKLCGVLTDGDVRRLLLKGKSVDYRISQADLGDYVSAPIGIDHESLLKLTSKRVRIIPLVNQDGQVQDYFRYEHKSNFVPVAEPDLKGNELKYLTDAFLSTWISSRGEYIDRFESEFAQYCGVNYGVSTSNGTVALHLALEALGIGEGDEVIVPDLTFAATINAVLHAKATPVIVDVDRESWTICPHKIREAVNPKTKAIIPVHIYGQACDMDAIMNLAQEHKLYVIEDAAEAHGAEFKGRKVGSFGHISTFSFFANKVITTGEGGMCVTNDAQLDEKMRMLRDHGMSKEKRYWHECIGYNYRMTNLQAAIGCAQLERIEAILKNREALEQHYKSVFTDANLQWQHDFENRKRTVWLVSLLVEDRDQWQQKLKEKGIDSRPFFYPLSSMPIYAKYAPKACAIAHEIALKGISLPTSSEGGFGDDKVNKKILLA